MVPCSGFGGRGAVFIVDAREADGGIEGHTVPLRFGGKEHAPPTKTRCFCGWWENLRKKALTNSVVMWLYQLKVNRTQINKNTA